ncbi:MAG TPA: DUF4062 domain-containing protein [Casimicrobiaceae bacterium]|jgi:hypothetical protein|nr:DUF4062 domain-containing protein [Casimicrobiaceae bacterium]
MRVYISSTYIDLVEHRAAVARLLRQMGHEVIGMEEYVAEGSRPLDRCLKDVDSAEIYVGIFAWRYGYVPPSPPPPANDPATVAPPRVSVTESEFRRAAGKRPLVFMLDPKATWPVQYIDALAGTSEDAAAVKRFRDELSSQWLAGFFTTPEDLARQVSAAVYRREVTDRLGTISGAPGLTDSLMYGGPIVDSTLMSLQQSLVRAPELRVLTVDLRDGNYWWSTRLFFLAAVAGELAGTRLLIFTENGERYLGAATTATVRDRLASMSTPLRQFLDQCRQQAVIAVDLARALDQRAYLWNTIVNQVTEDAERSFVTARDLRRWLGDDLLENSVTQDGDTVSNELLRSIIDWPHPYVPITENGNLRKVVARASVADNLARIFVESLDRTRA